MTGGLLNLVSYGKGSIRLYGNPSKTFFKSTYKQITNFGMQKFRVNYKGSKQLRVNTESEITFDIPRNAELLKDTCVVLNIPDIWSPLYYNTDSEEWVETGFKWIEELGSNMIKEVEIKSGGQLLATYSGEYFSCLHQRDSSKDKKDLWNRMTGNIKELYDPANAFSRVNTYPNVYNGTPANGTPKPSIYGRKLFIPLDTFFSTSPGMAFPLISLQYSQLNITIRFRPIKELYTIREVTNNEDNYPYIAPNQNETTQQFQNFVNPPVDNLGNVNTDNTDWNVDLHLMCTYIFLDQKERIIFSKNPQRYLIKDVITKDIFNLARSNIVDIESKGLVCNYTFRLRRSDAFLRNEWSNYTNWAYNTIPYDITNTSSSTPNTFLFTTQYINPEIEDINTRDILVNLGLLLDGKYRENVLDEGIYNYLEKYNNTKGSAKDGLYLYSFELNTDNKQNQPSGAMNMDKFNKIQMEILTINPPINPNPQITNICDPATGNVIGTRKNVWNLNEYNFDLRIFEERYNFLLFQNGICGLEHSR